jgi:hypothetical protein
MGSRKVALWAKRVVSAEATHPSTSAAPLKPDVSGDALARHQGWGGVFARRARQERSWAAAGSAPLLIPPPAQWAGGRDDQAP